MKNCFQAIIASFYIMLLMTGCTAEPPQKETANTNPIVPEALKVFPNETLIFTAYAEGVQVYQCDSLGKWIFVAPDAVLFNEKGDTIGTHGKGPFWELKADGSRVIANSKTAKNVNAPSFGAIPWLLLEKLSTEGNGEFSRVTRIQRVDTNGGKKPVNDASPDCAGQEIRIPYSATYYFYTAG